MNKLRFPIYFGLQCAALLLSLNAAAGDNLYTIEFTAVPLSDQEAPAILYLKEVTETDENGNKIISGKPGEHRGEHLGNLQISNNTCFQFLALG